MKHCPNSACSNHKNPPPHWYVKYGSYKPKTTNQKTPRYRCKTCGKLFSTHTFKSTVNQKKPEINSMLFKMLVSGVSLRRASEILNVKYDTVVRRFHYLARQAEVHHHVFLKTVQTSYVQVDELETVLHARPKALSVPMVVRVKTGEILGFAVAKMPAKGLLASVGASLYKWTTDERSRKFQSMLRILMPCFKVKATFKCDSNPSYSKWITNIIPHAQVDQIVAGKKVAKSLGVAKPFDALFAINNVFARLRHDMNRLGRKTWSTTKTVEGLEDHLWLYVAWNNGYKLK
jgi:transposase-like protein